MIDHFKNILEIITQTQNSDITETDLLQDIPHWDSLTALRMMMQLESEFSIKIPLYKFMDAKTVGDIISLIEV